MKTENERKNRTILITTSAVLLALGVLLPQALHSIPNAGKLFSPMHIPVLLTGLLCGPFFGAIVGALTPILSWAIFQMPSEWTGLIPMVFELLCYGLVSGGLSWLLNKKIKSKNIVIIIALISAMITGRLINICIKLIIFSAFMGKGAEVIFVSGLVSCFVTCWPAIIIQIILIPMLMIILEKNGVLSKYKWKLESDGRHNG